MLYSKLLVISCCYCQPEATIEQSGKLTIAEKELTQYRIIGLSFKPQTIWLENNGDTAANISSWFSVFQTPLEQAIPQLQEAQQNADNLWSKLLALQIAHVPKGDLLIRDARLFDPRDLSVTSGMSVLVHGDRIIRVAAAADLKGSPNAEIIDAHGRFLMPGLWDNHQHFSDIDGPLDLANASQALATWRMTLILSCNVSRISITAPNSARAY